MLIQNYLEMIIKWILTSGLQIIFVAVLMIIALNIVNNFTEKLIKNFISSNSDLEFEKRVNTLRSITKSVLDVLILVVGSMIILEKLGINIGPMLAAAGVLGLAVSFGSQRLVEDIISGFIILISDQIRVGDVAQIGDKSGLVEKIDLKMIVLRDVDGNVHFIRNGKIDTITNMTKDYSCYVFNIGIDCKENTDNVIEIIKSVDEDMRNNSQFTDDILEPIEVFGLDKFDDSAVIIKARTKTKPIMQWAVGREFNRRLKMAFDAHNIEIPFPHRTIFMEQKTKENQSQNKII